MNSQNNENSRMAFDDMRTSVKEQNLGMEHWLFNLQTMVPIAVSDSDGKDRLALSVRMDGADETRVLHPTPLAKRQLAEIAEIPVGYFDSLADRNIGLLTRCIRDGVNKLGDKSIKLGRVQGDDVKALLSHRFQILDNDFTMELANMLVKEFDMEPGDCTLSADGTLVVNILSRKLHCDVGKVPQGERQIDDIIRFGIRITNNENGGGAFKVSLLTYRLVCLNGMTLPRGGRSAVNFSHSGSPYGHEVAGAIPLEPDEVHRVDPGEVMSKTMEAVGGIMTESAVQSMGNKIKAAQQRFFNAQSAERLVRAIGRALGVNAGDAFVHGVSGDIFGQRETDGRIDLWKTLNAFTREAQRLGDVNVRAAVEDKAHKILGFGSADIERIQRDAEKKDGADEAGEMPELSVV